MFLHISEMNNLSELMWYENPDWFEPRFEHGPLEFISTNKNPWNVEKEIRESIDLLQAKIYALL